MSPRPITLIILDGWGHRDATEFNAIHAAKKPTWEHLWKEYPHTLISGSGTCVGLPPGQMGNSEVGHLNMGSGRLIYQDLMRINVAIEDGTFFSNPVFNQAFAQIKKTNHQVHVLGLLSPGGVHSHETHIHALLKLIGQYQLKKVFLHPFLDGRDTPPQSALSSLEKLESIYQQVGCGKTVSLIGRYYAMDRDKRWERIAKAYELLVNAQAPYHAPNAHTALQMAYARGETDEFVSPTLVGEENQPPTINDGDSVIMMNFRADRARELMESLSDAHFNQFTRSRWPKLSALIGLSHYDDRLSIQTAFPATSVANTLAACISRAGLHQLRLAETEKYAHVTFFFNGGLETPYPGEDRVLIPSPTVATYDLKPAMSAVELTDTLVHAIQEKKYDLIICNYANPDMVGHTGNFAATVEAIEIIDQCLGRVIRALKAVGGEALITADHGNAEKMYDEKTKQPHTAHTSELVPFLYVGRPAEILQKNGKLSDISPTILELLNLPKPVEMTGNSLLKLV